MQQNQIANDMATVVVNTILLGSRPGTVIGTALTVAHLRETAGMRINRVVPKLLLQNSANSLTHDKIQMWYGY